MTKLDKLQDRIVRLHQIRCDGELGFHKHYREALFNYADELISGKSPDEIANLIIKLEEEAVVMQDQMTVYQEFDGDLGELQEDYRGLVAKHVRLLDLLKCVKS